MSGSTSTAARRARPTTQAIFRARCTSTWSAGSPRRDRRPKGAIRCRRPRRSRQGMSACGIGDDTAVVAYDDAGGVIAARLVWMLRALGRDAALLDGGLGAWDGPLETTETEVAPAVFTPRPWPADRLASADDAAAGRERHRRRPPAGALRRRARRHRPARRPHPRRPVAPLPRAPRQPTAGSCHSAQLRAAPGRRGHRRRSAGRLLLRLRRHRLPQPAGDRARRAGRRPPLPGLVVAVEPRRRIALSRRSGGE